MNIFLDLTFWSLIDPIFSGFFVGRTIIFTIPQSSPKIRVVYHGLPSGKLK